jgi:hypothetical protein
MCRLRWIPTDSFRFVHEKSSGSVTFRGDSTGAIRELFAGGFYGWQTLN